MRANMVSTLDGVMRGSDGTSRAISSAADQRVFSMLRAPADVILVGAGTIRAEDYHPSRTPIAIVTASLDLPPTLRLFSLRTEQSPRTIVLTTAAAASTAAPDLLAAADIVTCGETSVDLCAAVEALVERGLTRIHCEGGPRLLSDLAAAGLLDELLLTVTPLLHGGSASEHILSIAGGFDPPLRLVTDQVLEEDGSVFLRARRDTGGA